MNDLQQFVGATVVAVHVGRFGAGARATQFYLHLRMPGGGPETRELALYTLQDAHALCVRIDGMYVPPEEL